MSIITNEDFPGFHQGCAYEVPTLEDDNCIHPGSETGICKIECDCPRLAKPGKWEVIDGQDRNISVCLKCYGRTLHPYFFCPHCGSPMEV